MYFFRISVKGPRYRYFDTACQNAVRQVSKHPIVAGCSAVVKQRGRATYNVAVELSVFTPALSVTTVRSAGYCSTQTNPASRREVVEELL